VAVEQLALAERETKTLQIQMSEKETELAEALRKLKTYEENLHEKQRELVSLRSELHLTSKDKREMMEDFRAQLTAEFAEKTNDMEKALEEKTAEVTALKTQVEGLESEVSQAKEEVKTLEENNKSFLITVNTLQGLVPPHPHFHFFVANLPIFDPCTDKTFPFSRRRLKLAAREGLTRPSPMRSQRSWSLLPVSCFLLLLSFSKWSHAPLSLRICRKNSHPSRGKVSASEGSQEGEALRGGPGEEEQGADPENIRTPDPERVCVEDELPRGHQIPRDLSDAERSGN